MKKPKFSTTFSVGFVVFVATLLLMSGLFLVGNSSNFFARHVEFLVRFPSATGLRSGSRVYLSGVHVGSVGSIRFPDDLTLSQVEVALRIERGYSSRIREDSFAWLQNEGLFGDVSIHVKLGTAGRAQLPPGSFITYKERSLVDELVGEDIRTNTAELLQSGLALLREINHGDGTVGRLLKDPALYENLTRLAKTMDATSREVDHAAKEIASSLADLRAQKGTLGKLLYSEDYAREFSAVLGDAAALTADLKGVAEDVRAGKGSVGKLFADPSMHDSTLKAVTEIASVAGRMETILSRAEAEGSILGRIATDGKTGRDFAATLARLEGAAESLARILDSVDRGEGSVGMLVRDPSLAGSLRDVFLGVQEDSILRSVVRGAERDGREAYLRSADLARREAEELLRAKAILEEARKSGPVPAASPDGSGVKLEPAGARMDGAEAGESTPRDPAPAP